MNWMYDKEPKIHRAVLEENDSVLRELISAHPNSVQEVDADGFTAFELACFLDKQRAIAILNPLYLERKIPVIPKGSNKIKVLSVEQFRELFDVNYISHLKFPNYAVFKEVLGECPLILRTRIGDENRQLAERYRKEIISGSHTDLIIRWIDPEMGYGLFAARDLPIGTYVCEYAGVVRLISRFNPDQNEYCFHYPTKFWSWNYCVVDAQSEGNEARFINHNDQPNLQPICLLDRGILHLAFVTSRAVSFGEELTFNYGEDYWRKREKIKESVVVRDYLPVPEG